MKASTWNMIALVFLLGCVSVLAAPLGEHTDRNDGSENKSDVPVEQLEKLKTVESKEEEGNTHIEFHQVDAVKADGELVSRLEQHASADSVPGGPPQVHSQAQLDVPSAGVHRVVVQDGSHVSVVDGTATSAPNEETTAKVFHGAARLVQPGSMTNAPPSGHTTVRRSFNADITKETKNNMDHYAAYSGVQYSPLDMAEYIFWTGDQKGVTTAVQEFLQEGIMTKEEAIAFLQEIKFNIYYLRTHYSQNLKAAEESAAQQEKLRSMLLEQAQAKEFAYRSTALQSFAFGNSPDIIRSIASKNWDLSNNLSPVPSLPVTSDLRPEAAKRYDPMLQTNVLSTSDYERDAMNGPIISEEEYEEMMDKLKAADNLYTEYTLEEIIYQLAKMMFSQSLSHDPASARAATQRFMAFLEMEAERGQLSRSIEKKVLDVMIAALTDTIGDHPELLQNHEQGGPNRMMRQFLEASAAEPSMSRAILAAYKDELLKGPTLPHKYNFDH